MVALIEQAFLLPQEEAVAEAALLLYQALAAALAVVRA
jgi:hypothetical protein